MPPAVRNALLVLTAALLLALPETASALEKKPVGDIVVREGEVLPEASTGWGDITVDGEVSGDVRSGFGDVEINGPVGGDVEVGFGQLAINSRVQGGVSVGHGDVRLGPEAEVGRVSVGNGSIDPHPDAVIRDAESLGAASEIRHSLWAGLVSGIPEMASWMLAALGLAAVGILLVALVPRPVWAAARSLETAPGRALLLGLASLPGVFILSVLLAVTIIGIPVLLLAVPAYLALVIFGVLVVAYLLGRRVLIGTGYYRGGDVAAVGLGAILVSAVYLIPLLGGALLALLALLGTGAAISAALFRRQSGHPSYEAYLRDRRGR
ncbi:hypothetical protein E0L93_12670 [Rubrobacter taiwanensis]|jgi:hypothetical protein|uniref:DUF8173 domain-containing protein n=1 Tax=Rubrobacter taiwanensis TaxID=185139 RepID=A0A4V2NW20_9ACTN|nr:hypothetical protein [Rubrobacter taiwanensis]TCJ15662.1 hypothetical protein E0L93_12670 [Rubrobacter taiwanensis]